MNNGGFAGMNEGFVVTNHHSRPRRPAVFLDRDGTVNREVNYLSDPEQLELLPTVSQTIANLNARGVAVVVITNQAGIGRGFFPEDRLILVHQRLRELLAEQNATLDGIYYCPHHPTAGVGEYRIECDCRKPQPGMLIHAARDLGIDLSDSLMIGDRDTDLLAGANAGCQTALVRTGYGEETSRTIQLETVRGIGIYDHVGDAVAQWLRQKSGA